MISNKELKYIKSLRIKKHRINERCFIVEGEKMIDELLKSNYRIVRLYATKEWILKNSDKFTNYIEISIIQLSRISQFKNANKVLAIVDFPSKKIINDNGITILLDNIKDPGNFGSILRTCDWFGIKQIICSNECVDVFNFKVVHASMGSIFRLNVQYLDLLKFIKKSNSSSIYAACMNGKPLKSTSFKKNCIIVLGNESRGISKEILTYVQNKFTIRRLNYKVESLNVVTATGIILHHLSENIS